MLQQLKIWGIRAGGDSIDFEDPIATYDGKPFSPFHEIVEIDSEEAFSLPEEASGIAAVGAGEHSAVFFVNADGSASITASTSAVNGDNPSLIIGDLAEDEATQIGNATDEPLDVQVFFFHTEQDQ